MQHHDDEGEKLFDGLQAGTGGHRLNAAHGALQVRPVQKLDQGPKSKVARLPAHYRRHVLMAETDIEKALAMLEYTAARRGLYLTVHALNKVKEVLKWELVGDREKALDVSRNSPEQKP